LFVRVVCVSDTVAIIIGIDTVDHTVVVGVCHGIVDSRFSLVAKLVGFGRNLIGSFFNFIAGFFKLLTGVFLDNHLFFGGRCSDVHIRGFAFTGSQSQAKRASSSNINKLFHSVPFRQRKQSVALKVPFTQAACAEIFT
tara:strand:- start:1628 stop:2044 length:417 start_codon:yes stop_codon:yes gene_type:complete